MAAVESVTGPVEADDLGVTLVHEHLRFRDEDVAHQWPHAYDEDESYRLAVEAAERALANGVKTLCEPTVMFGGRDVDFLRRIAEETGVQLIASTGIYSYDYLPHYFVNRDADAMAELFVHDIEQGIQGTDIK